MSIATSTRIVVNENSVRQTGGEHVLKVSSGLCGGACVQYNPAMVADLMAAQGGEGVAWFISKPTALALSDALRDYAGQ